METKSGHEDLNQKIENLEKKILHLENKEENYKNLIFLLVLSQSSDLQNSAEKELKDALHELQVHQVELQAQNEDFLQMQAQIEKSQRKYLDLFDTAPIGYIVHDSNGIIKEVNQTMANLVHRPKYKLCNNRLSLFISKSNYELLAIHLQRVSRTGNYNSQIEFVKPDGQIIYTEMKSIAIPTMADNPHIRTTVNNIELRKKAERALSESEKQFRLFMNHFPGPVFIHDEQCNLKYVNSSYIDIFHQSKPGNDDHSINKNTIFCQEQDKDVVENGSSIVFESVFHVPEGPRTFLTRKFPIFRDGKETLIGGFSVDITENKKDSVRLNQVREEWEKTFNSVSDFIAIMDKDYRILNINQSMAQIFGYSDAQSLRGKYCYTIFHCKDHPSDTCPHKKVMSEGKEYSCEMKYPRLQDDYWMTATPMYNENGELFGSVIVIRTIS